MAGGGSRGWLAAGAEAAGREELQLSLPGMGQRRPCWAVSTACSQSSCVCSAAAAA